VTILIVLGTWFVGSVVLGLLAARFLRFSEASCLLDIGGWTITLDTIDVESDFSRSLIADRQLLSTEVHVPLAGQLDAKFMSIFCAKSLGGGQPVLWPRPGKAPDQNLPCERLGP
jgi:hypothetical protein